MALESQILKAYTWEFTRILFWSAGNEVENTRSKDQNPCASPSLNIDKNVNLVKIVQKFPTMFDFERTRNGLQRRFWEKSGKKKKDKSYAISEHLKKRKH